MKTKKILFVAFIAMMLSSCATSYFQVYKVIPSDKLILKDNLLVYEDENCKVLYNLWCDGGNIGFQFFNKTDKNIYLNLEESFFILDGVAYNYYRNRVYTSSKVSGVQSLVSSTAAKSVTSINYLDLFQTNKNATTNTVGSMTSSGFSVSYNEEKIVCIPSYTSKIISEYSINEYYFRNCDLYKYPTKKQINVKTFTKEESPLVFSNRIAYTIGQDDNLLKFENEFYISEISNYPESEMFELQYYEYCGQQSTYMIKYFKNASADKFYIEYSKGEDSWKH